MAAGAPRDARWLARAAVSPETVASPEPIRRPELVASPELMGLLQPMGSPQPLGSPQPMGSPRPIGSPQPIWSPQSMGSPQPSGPKAAEQFLERQPGAEICQLSRFGPFCWPMLAKFGQGCPTTRARPARIHVTLRI